jgi:hypothetical protein
MNVRQSDISRILMNPKHKRLSGLGEVSPHFLDPLSRRHRMQGNDPVTSRILRLRTVPTERKQQGEEEDSD